MTREDLASWHVAVVDALAGLPTAQGSAVRMSYFNRLSRTEIARRLEVSPSQAGRLLAEGLRALAAELVTVRGSRSLPAGTA